MEENVSNELKDILSAPQLLEVVDRVAAVHGNLPLHQLAEELLSFLRGMVILFGLCGCTHRGVVPISMAASIRCDRVGVQQRLEKEFILHIRVEALN